ncbi:ACR3 family arsenite efflux transporter [Desulfobotulus mexicanus]|uniref:ACR3 family arsenite efflux transporter n=1 Tax=Desulfobotulus mexicanus TaxID=2586642 RepID=A0A5Q4VGB0_9BACT|nr:ACR3 family arsenite efflux transporter [Desulfobotulus mexicanus]TYT75978.1 ACR3 family arsenite efflux transporter [Desulfobotulus mexicanus]
MTAKDSRPLGFFERYLTLWVALCMVAGILIGFLFPGMAKVINAMSIEQVNLPIGLLLFLMIYPIMIQIDFPQVAQALKTPRPVLTTLVINWGIKPFTMTFFAWIFMFFIWAPFIPEDMASEYFAGMVLLGIAPCTAMVFVWSYLSKANMGLTLVMVAINSLTMLVLYAPLGSVLLGVALPIPFITLSLTVGFYVGVPLVAGWLSRRYLIHKKGKEWFDTVYVAKWGKVSIIALLATLVSLFILQGDVILRSPLVIVMIAIPLIIQTFAIFGLGYVVCRFLGISYEDAAPTSMIGASNHFEVAIAVAITMFGVTSGAALAAVVGLLIEVPIMLALVRFCLRTKAFFPSEPEKAPIA